MAGRKASAVSGKNVQAMKLPDALALREKVVAGDASPSDRELFDRLVTFWRGRYRSGRLSEKAAQQLGLA